MFEVTKLIAKKAIGRAGRSLARRTKGIRGWSATALSAVMVFATLASGCVPVPYRPSANISHSSIAGTTPATITVSSASKRAAMDSLAQSIHEVEPRVVVDLTPDFGVVFSHGDQLDQILDPEHAAQMATRPAEYLLTVGPMVNRQLHDTGAAAPFPFFPVIWVGYEKVQSIETECASFIDLHNPQAIDGILVASPYTEVIAAMVYGVSTIAMPQTPMRRLLAEDVAHRLAAANPVGEIHLTLLAQDGGDEPGVHTCTPVPPNTLTAKK